MNREARAALRRTPIIKVEFGVGDLDFTNWSMEDRVTFLYEHKRTIEDILCSRGNEAIGDLVRTFGKASPDEKPNNR